MSTINAGVAMVKVLESWGIDHIYGKSFTERKTLYNKEKEDEHTKETIFSIIIKCFY